RSVSDFDRFETGQLVLHETSMVLGDVAAEVVAELARRAEVAGKPLSLSRLPAGVETALSADRDLVKRVIANLVMNAIKRGQAGRAIAVGVAPVPGGVRFS